MRVIPADLSRAKLRERRDTHSLSVPKTATQLNCIQERIKNWSLKRLPQANTKYRNAKFIFPKSQVEVVGEDAAGVDDPLASCDTPVEVIEPLSDVLITIRIMGPCKYDPNKVGLQLKMDREVIFLGQQYLYEFRDMVCCPCDTIGPFVDISKDPSADVRAGDKYADKTNSGFLFIGDTFYNDMRNTDNGDHSKEVIAWAKQVSEIKELKQARMEETKFIDLKGIRFGFPYVYQHFGQCEHVFLFSDIRVITEEDNRVKSDYPYLHLMNNFRNVVCDICATYEATHSVTGSTQHIFDPVRLCAKCLSSYHYVDGKKLGEFSVYRIR